MILLGKKPRLAELLQEIRELRKQQGALFDYVRQIDAARRYNINDALDRDTVRETGAFVREHMPLVPASASPRETMQRALEKARRGGLALEFGVHAGSTLRAIAEDRGDGRVFGFDSFQGLPEQWRPNFPAGTFAQEQLPDVPGAQLVVGWFEETLPGFLREHPGPVDFVHIDCDLYSSTRTVLALLEPRLTSGTVLLFDEYFNYPGWQDHEHKAWTEFARRTGTRVEYLSYTFNHQQLAMRIL